MSILRQFVGAPAPPGRCACAAVLLKGGVTVPRYKFARRQRSATPPLGRRLPTSAKLIAWSAARSLWRILPQSHARLSWHHCRTTRRGVYSSSVTGLRLVCELSLRANIARGGTARRDDRIFAPRGGVDHARIMHVIRGCRTCGSRYSRLVARFIIVILRWLIQGPSPPEKDTDDRKDNEHFFSRRSPPEFNRCRHALHRASIHKKGQPRQGTLGPVFARVKGGGRYPGSLARRRGGMVYSVIASRAGLTPSPTCPARARWFPKGDAAAKGK